VAYNEELATRVRNVFASRKVPFVEKRMMGGLCFLVDDKMCVGVEKERLMVRLDPESYEPALTRKGCGPMDFTGRPMRGFVFVNSAGYSTDADLATWLELALAFNPKAKSSKQRTKRAASKSNPPKQNHERAHR
jgi:TfoX/Sxy family transcriptional regulator of competence genes